jgi:hypothetical protein
MSVLRRDRDYLSRSERLPKPSEHHKIGVERDLGESAHSQRSQAVADLQVAERPLNRSAASVEVAPALCVARDARQEPSTYPDGQDWLLALHPGAG